MAAAVDDVHDRGVMVRQVIERLVDRRTDDRFVR
jgi:hypothetical protein